MTDSYTPRTRLADERTRRSLDKLARSWERFEIGAITGSQRSGIDGTFSFGAYATGGSAIPGLGAAPIVTMPPWTDGAGLVRLFKWDSGTHKMIVTDAGGTEIAAATDLSAIASHPYRAALSAVETPSGQMRLAGAGRILAVEFEVGTAFTADITNYWTVRAALRRIGAQRDPVNGETIGTYSTARRSLAVQAPVVLYANDVGTIFRDSDRLVVEGRATGNPLPILGAVAWVKVARSAG